MLLMLPQVVMVLMVLEAEIMLLLLLLPWMAYLAVLRLTVLDKVVPLFQMLLLSCHDLHLMLQRSPVQSRPLNNRTSESRRQGCWR